MIALFWILVATFALLLIAPPLLFICMSLEPHREQRQLRATTSPSNPPRVSKISVRTPAPV